ncbi:MAG: phosphoribosylglycinamide formyltransferase [Gammaproteobacteria bacterium]|nr:phosphoribosylglycinamide formyltransferase [Gammaproteobacteria bacterium]
MSEKSLSIVVLISGSGSNLQAIIDALQEQSINAEIKAVFSNKKDVLGLDRARQAGISDIVIDHSMFSDRLSFDQAMIQEIDKYDPELIILAGFMRILSNEFVNHYAGRLINIHPALLPNFKGLNTHQRALDAKHKKHGASVHFVTNELDGGPVITQAEVTVKENDDAESLRLRVLEQEHFMYPEVIKWFAEHRIKLDNNIIYFDQQALEKPLLINKENQELQ